MSRKVAISGECPMGQVDVGLLASAGGFLVPQACIVSYCMVLWLQQGQSNRFP